MGVAFFVNSKFKIQNSKIIDKIRDFDTLAGSAFG